MITKDEAVRKIISWCKTKHPSYTFAFFDSLEKVTEKTITTLSRPKKPLVLFVSGDDPEPEPLFNQKIKLHFDFRVYMILKNSDTQERIGSKISDESFYKFFTEFTHQLSVETFDNYFEKSAGSQVTEISQESLSNIRTGGSFSLSVSKIVDI